MKINHFVLASVIMAGSLCAMSAQADVITSNSGFSLLEDFESVDGVVTRGPLLLSSGVSVASSVYSTLGASAVDLIDNGVWGAGNRFAGIGDLSLFPSTDEGFLGAMTFNLSETVNGVGALFSIYNDGSVSGQITIEALGAGGSLLESTTFSVGLNDPFLYNAGLFYGITRASADIVGLRVSGDGFVVDNLSIQPVPLPAALPLLIGGLAMFGAVVRRRRSLAA